MIHVYCSPCHHQKVLYRTLEDALGTNSFRCVSANDIHRGLLQTEPPSLFLMPGGQASNYDQELGLEGRKNIIAYVENGGRYLGLCGGAYWACREYRWYGDIRTALPALFNGVAYGPVFKGAGEAWDCAVGLRYEDAFSRIQTKVHYFYGPAFHVPEAEIHSGHVRVLGHYTDLEEPIPAILEAQKGKGFVTLCGPHPESQAEHLSGRNAGEQDMILTLGLFQAEQKRIWRDLLTAGPSGGGYVASHIDGDGFFGRGSEPANLHKQYAPG